MALNLAARTLIKLLSFTLCLSLNFTAVLPLLLECPTRYFSLTAMALVSPTELFLQQTGFCSSCDNVQLLWGYWRQTSRFCFKSR